MRGKFLTESCVSSAGELFIVIKTYDRKETWLSRLLEAVAAHVVNFLFCAVRLRNITRLEFYAYITRGHVISDRKLNTFVHFCIKTKTMNYSVQVCVVMLTVTGIRILY